MDVSSVLGFLAGLATDDFTRYSADFKWTHYYYPEKKLSYSLSVRKNQFHSWCIPVVADPPASSSVAFEVNNEFLYEQSGLEAAVDLPLQAVARAVVNIPGLAHVRLAIDDFHRRDEEVGKYFDALLPALLTSLCPSPTSSVLKQIVVQIWHYDSKKKLSDFMTLPSTIPSLEALQLNLGSILAIDEDDAERISSLLRNYKALKSLQLTLCPDSWQILSALEIMLEPLRNFSRDKNTIGNSGHKNVRTHVLQKLELKLDMIKFYGDGVVDVEAAVKIVTLMLDIVELNTVAELSFSIGIGDGFQLNMRFEHGRFVELHVPACRKDITAGVDVVVQVLGLNRGPNVLTLGPLQRDVLREILCALIVPHDHRNCHRVCNTCVSTLKLLNISEDKLSGTVQLQRERVREVAKLIESNSSVKHVEVTRIDRGFEPEPYRCKPKSSVVIALQNRLTSQGSSPFTFMLYGEDPLKCSGSSTLSDVNADCDVENQQQSEQQVQCTKHLESYEEMSVVVLMKRRWRYFGKF